MKYAEFFAGIGGFRCGLEILDWTSQYVCEIDKKCEQTYSANFNSTFNGYDIYDVNVDQLPEGIEVFTAGFPCQAFSIAGKKKGFSDIRGNIFFKLLELIRDYRPNIFILENVVHLKNHYKGQTFKKIIESLYEGGYTVFTEILDASSFGIPQARRRLFFIGFRKELGVSLFNITRKGNYKSKTMKDILISGEFSVPVSKKWDNYIDLYQGKKSLEEIPFEVPKTRRKLERINPKTDLEDCIFQMRSSGIRAIPVNSPSPTLAVSVSGGGAMIPVYSKERRHLGLRELARIMGFDDCFQFPVSRTDAIKQLANSVCPAVITSIGRDIEDAMRLVSTSSMKN